jgi:hypothetical protein
MRLQVSPTGRFLWVTINSAAPAQKATNERARVSKPCNVGLFSRRDLFDRLSLGVGVFALFIGLAQDLGDDFTALLLGPSFLLLPQFGEELVVHFPAH